MHSVSIDSHNSNRPFVLRAELIILDRESLLEQLQHSTVARRMGPVWTLDLSEDHATILTVDESRVLFTYKQERDRIAVGNQIIGMTSGALGWPSVGLAA